MLEIEREKDTHIYVDRDSKKDIYISKSQISWKENVS